MVDVARDMVRKLSIQESARQVAQEAIKIVQGEHYDPYPVIRQLEELKVIHATTDHSDKRELNLDVDSLLSGMDEGYSFAFNLPSLDARVPGIEKRYVSYMWC